MGPSRGENVAALNEAGAAGWELCHVGHEYYLMKRLGYRQVNTGITHAIVSPTVGLPT
jgi:hypothetical protein